jgi:integrase
MKGTIRATVKMTWINGHGERCAAQKERRYAAGTKPHVIADWKKRTRAQLEARIPATVGSRAIVLGTLKADALRYYPLIRHLADWVTRRSEIRAWEPHLGDRYRHAIERVDILRIRGLWKEAGVANRTINNRVSALKDLYKKLDGDDTATPCDSVAMLPPPRIPIQRVSPDTINAVMTRLEQRALNGRKGRPCKHATQDRARLMVLATTGKRPCEVERALPMDVNLDQRVWGVRDAKGGWSEGVYLNDEMLIAWRAFFDAQAWGSFGGKFAHRLRAAGWPEGVRVYNARHSTWIAASERGADLGDIQAGAGHRHQRTTREHYVPVLQSRMQRLSELIDHRFGWVPATQPADPAKTEEPLE